MGCYGWLYGSLYMCDGVGRFYFAVGALTADKIYGVLGGVCACLAL